jgi:hypothetical protein
VRRVRDICDVRRLARLNRLRERMTGSSVCDTTPLSERLACRGGRLRRRSGHEVLGGFEQGPAGHTVVSFDVRPDSSNAELSSEAASITERYDVRN